jgi:hypothetical protein
MNTTFLTEYEVDGEKYASSVKAPSFTEAQLICDKNGLNEEIVGFIPKVRKQTLLWNKLKKELKPLNDNNYTARIIYDYINKKFEPK